MKGNAHAKKKPKDRTKRPFPPQATETPTRSAFSCSRRAAYHRCQPDAIRAVGEAYWGEMARFAYWCYDQLNPRCFDRRIPHPLIQFCRVMPYGRCGAMSHVDDLQRPVIDVFSSLWTQPGCRYVKLLGVLAHEMLHFHCSQLWQQTEEGWYHTSHNNEWWLQEVKEISPLLDVHVESIEPPYARWPYEGWNAWMLQEFDEALSDGQWPF